MTKLLFDRLLSMLPKTTSDVAIGANGMELTTLAFNATATFGVIVLNMYSLELSLYIARTLQLVYLLHFVQN